MIDIDDFKAINGSHGHLVGDDVFGTLGTTIGHSIRKMDRPARYGGEELTVIIPKAGLAHAGNAAERIRQSIEGMLFQGFRVTVSIGVGQTNRNIGTVKALIEAADAALYKAKRQGKNCVVIAEQNTG